MNGSDALLTALSEQGVEVIFGNPGSTELPLVHALATPGAPRFVLGLTEAAVMGMADGYAQSSGRLGVALVHVQPGMANALSGVLNAARARVPLLVIVGQQLSSMLPGAPFLGGEVVGMAAPIARSACEVTHPAQLEGVLNDAVAAALGPPMGPAVVSIPLESQVCEIAACAPLPRAGRPLAPPAADVVFAVASLLNRAHRPIILAGDGVTHGGAQVSLSALAAQIGAPVMSEPFVATTPMAADDPMWAGPLPRFATDIRHTLTGHDVVFAIGMPVFRLFGWSPGPALPDTSLLIHVDVDPDEIGRMYAPEVGAVADPRLFIDAVAAQVADHADRRATVAASICAARAAAEEALRQRAALGGPTITGAHLCVALAAAAPPDAVIVDEGVTSTRDLRVALGARQHGLCMWHRGSALGWGLPAAVGAAIANPLRRVICTHGDGSLMFGIQALWTAAAEGSRLALVVADNASYEILRAGLEGLTGVPDAGWPGLAVTSPHLNIAEICHGFGASSARVDEPADLHNALRDLMDRSDVGPAVLVVGVRGETPAVGGPLHGAPGV